MVRGSTRAQGLESPGEAVLLEKDCEPEGSSDFFNREAQVLGAPGATTATGGVEGICGDE